MTTPREVWALNTRRLGRRVHVFDTVESTNTLAAGLAGDRAQDGLALLADEQTGGRGQHGRRWLAPPRSGVLLSLLLFPPPALLRPAVLTAWAAVSVCGVVRQTTGLDARIKWPNDVLLRGRKVCGILIEQGQGGGTVAGIGLNVTITPAEFAAAGLPDATSLGTFAAGPLDTYDVARALLRRLDDDYDALWCGDLATLEERWREHVGLLGRPVVAECVGAGHAGRLVGMGFDAVELEQAGGARRRLRPEGVLHLRPENP